MRALTIATEKNDSWIETSSATKSNRPVRRSGRNCISTSNSRCDAGGRANAMKPVDENLGYFTTTSASQQRL